MHKPYRVEVNTFATRVYRIDANSPEEAESIAEDMFKDGEDGNLLTEDLDNVEAILEENEEVEG